MFIFPDAEVLRTDAAFRKNGRCFRQHESGPADGATSKMHKVPIVGVTVEARILAHRRDKHTVAELEVANGERIKKMCHEVYATSFVTPLSSFRRSTGKPANNSTMTSRSVQFGNSQAARTAE